MWRLNLCKPLVNRVLVEKLQSSMGEPTSKGMAKAEMARMNMRRIRGLILAKQTQPMSDCEYLYVDL